VDHQSIAPRARKRRFRLGPRGIGGDSEVVSIDPGARAVGLTTIEFL
jgi:hypothetical protein